MEGYNHSEGDMFDDSINEFGDEEEVVEEIKDEDLSQNYAKEFDNKSFSIQPSNENKNISSGTVSRQSIRNSKKKA